MSSELHKYIEPAIDKKETQEGTIREKTIEKFRYDKIAFWLSIIAIGISLASLFF